MPSRTKTTRPTTLKLNIKAKRLECLSDFVRRIRHEKRLSLTDVSKRTFRTTNFWQLYQPNRAQSQIKSIGPQPESLSARTWHSSRGGVDTRKSNTDCRRSRRTEFHDSIQRIVITEPVSCFRLNRIFSFARFYECTHAVTPDSLGNKLARKR